MNGDNSKESLQLPPKPEWPIVTALKQGALLAAGMAVIGAIFSKIPVLKALWHRGAAKEAIDGAVFGAGIGGVFGFVEGACKHAEYPLQVENTLLKHQVKDLKPYKDYVERVVTEISKKELANEGGSPPQK